ncbi:MAG TPA: YggS family pyridoxal phosphate-dependent enzyme [Polyangia bacterium]|nr:YggS family pyridoxal phosphate-dependent enzyme [Polyangia bacterium]
MSRAAEIAAALRSVRERIAAAERAAGRAAGSARLVAVSKKMPPDDVRAALAAGQLDLGESYGQELRDKRQAFQSLAEGAAQPRWHFIGPLQANKVKYVAGHVALIHSIDSTELLDEIERRGADQAVLVQVNVAREARKRGAAPDALPALLDHFASLRHVRCEGLMTIPPLADDPEASRPHFAALRALRDREAARPRPNVELRELSMGMSDDLEVAVAEGATFVRVGTAIFGSRAHSP